MKQYRSIQEFVQALLCFLLPNVLIDLKLGSETPPEALLNFFGITYSYAETTFSPIAQDEKNDCSWEFNIRALLKQQFQDFCSQLFTTSGANTHLERWICFHSRTLELTSDSRWRIRIIFIAVGVRFSILEKESSRTCTLNLHGDAL